MKKAILIFSSLILSYCISAQTELENIESSIYKEVKPGKEVKLFYGSIGFPITNYFVLSQNTLLYSASTETVYLLDNKSQLIIDQLNLKSKELDFELMRSGFRLGGGDHINNKKVFHNSTFLRGEFLKYQNDSVFNMGIIKKEKNYFYFSIHVKKNKLFPIMKPLPEKERFQKPKKQTLEIVNYFYVNYIFDFFEINQGTTLIYLSDPWAEENHDKAINAKHKTHFETSVYLESPNNPKVKNLIRFPKKENYIWVPQSFLFNNNIHINTRKYESYFTINPKGEVSPYFNLDSLVKTVSKPKAGKRIHYYIIPDQIAKQLYIYITTRDKQTNNPQFHLFKFHKNKSFKLEKVLSVVSDKYFDRTKISNNTIYFQYKSGTEENFSNIYSLDLHKVKNQNLSLKSPKIKQYSLIEQESEWFKREITKLSSTRKNNYRIAPRSFARKFKTNRGDGAETPEKLFTKIKEEIKNRNYVEVLSNYTCYNKIEYKRLQNMMRKIDTKEYKEVYGYTNIEKGLKPMLESYFDNKKHIKTEHKRYKVEYKTPDGWIFYLVKIKDRWYLYPNIYWENVFEELEEAA